MALFDDFEGIDLATVRRFVADRQEEHLTLEFKRTSSFDLTDRDDKRHFAKALSGFANADGGIVVWGIGTSKQNGVDFASSEMPIVDVATFVGRLNEFTGVLANPRVEGVKHRKVQTEGGAGFAISLIPASDSGPHMAKGGLDQYFRRHGDRFLVMEHYELADMFGRRPRAQLKLEWSIPEAGSDSLGRFVRVQLCLRNIGRAPAAAPFLAVLPDDPASTRMEPRGLARFTEMDEALMRSVPMRDGSAYFGVRGLVLPPGRPFDVVMVVLRFPPGSGASARRIVCQVAAENSPYEEVTIDLDSEELARKLPVTY